MVKKCIFKWNAKGLEFIYISAFFSTLSFSQIFVVVFFIFVHLVIMHLLCTLFNRLICILIKMTIKMPVITRSQHFFRVYNFPLIYACLVGFECEKEKKFFLWVIRCMPSWCVCSFFFFIILFGYFLISFLFFFRSSFCHYLIKLNIKLFLVLLPF